MSTPELDNPQGLLTPEKVFKKAKMLTLMNNYEAQCMEFKKKEEENRQAKLLELEELRKRKADFLQFQLQNKQEKKNLQSNLASHYEQMANYQKALKEREKKEESERHEKFMEENRRAIEAEKERKRAKFEGYKQEQMDFLRLKEDERLKNSNNQDDFKKSNSSNIFKNKLKSLDEGNFFQGKPVYFEEMPDEQKKIMEKMKYRNFLDAQMQEKTLEKQKKKDVFSSQAELNLKKNEEFKEYQKQETQHRREEQLKYRQFLNLQTSEKNDFPGNEINRSNMNSTNQSLMQFTPNIKQNNEKIAGLFSVNNNNNNNNEIHNPLLNPMPFNIQNPYLFKEFKKGLLSNNSKQNAYFANIANAELSNKNYC